MGEREFEIYLCRPFAGNLFEWSKRYVKEKLGKRNNLKVMEMGREGWNGRSEYFLNNDLSHIQIKFEIRVP